MAREIDIDMVPDISLLEKIGATNFTLPEAIVELVANSIDARIPDRPSGTGVVHVPMEVGVDVQPEHVWIVDNAQGMTSEVLAEAVRLGVNMDDIIQRPDRKGTYGLGMKTACASLGHVWEIRTRPLGHHVEYRVEFDLDAFLRRAKEGAKAWRHKITEDAPDPRGPLKDLQHGTAIIVTRLRDSNPMSGAVLDHIGRAYRPHIEAGDVIKVNGTAAKPPEYNLLGKKFPLDEKCGAREEYQITGWVGLDNKVHNDDYFGLNLYRKGQLIEAWRKKDFFRIHLMTSRIVGEINLDFVPVNFNKRGFNEQSREWKVAIAHMRDFLRPVVKASETASKGRKDATRFARALEGLQRAIGAGGAISEMLETATRQMTGVEDRGDLPPNDGAYGPAVEVTADATQLRFPDGPITVTYAVEDMQDEETPWSMMFDDKNRELLAVLNSGSKLFQMVKDEHFLGMLALADTVALYLTTERGLSPAEGRRIRNKWLHAALMVDS